MKNKKILFFLSKSKLTHSLESVKNNMLCNTNDSIFLTHLQKCITFRIKTIQLIKEILICIKESSKN